MFHRWLRAAALAAVVAAGACDQAAEGDLSILADPALLDLGVDRPEDGATAVVRVANAGTAAGEITVLELVGSLAEYVAIDAADLPIELPPGGVAEIAVDLLALPPADALDGDLLLRVTVIGPSVRTGGCTDVALVQSEVVEIPIHAVGPGRCDRDEDGFVDVACGGDDCDDLDSATNPGADERCDGVDRDCSGVADDNEPVDGDLYYLDADADGWGLEADAVRACEAPEGRVADAGDCDDADPEVAPDAAETCDGVDQDCDGLVDEDPIDGDLYYPDLDADGFGTPNGERRACVEPPLWVRNADDCDDLNPAIRPGAEERCNSVDDNCDGQVDELGALGGRLFYADRDGDGFGDPTSRLEACGALPGFTERGGDCDDRRADVNPSEDERCDAIDHDCDGSPDRGAVDAPTWYADRDADLFGDPETALAACQPPQGFVADDSDCDDRAQAVFPGADELCNLIDDDCNRLVDDGAVDTRPYYVDGDRDGFGAAGVAFDACALPDGYAAEPSDCDDTEPTVYPGAPELCDGLDNDCDGQADSGVEASWYVDADGDGFGDPQSGELSCGQPEGRIADGTDCDDADPETFPGATELCDGVDQDCDGRADEDTVFYVDGDRDGFGKPGATVAAPACAQPPDTATNDDDCDDTDPLVNPAAEELCNLADDDCDGAVDEDAADARTWYRDVDADGWGNTRRTRVACARPGGWIARSGDCNDADAGINPGATELCDGLDNDCDASVDEDAGDSLVWFADGDGDGFGRPGSDLRACASPPGHVGNDGDCDDTDSLVFPGAPETCNGADDDCDGAIDEDPVDGRVIYADRDADGFGDDATARAVCERPGPGFVGRGGDCDDLDRTAFPGAPETCDGNDDDCDGLQDDGGVCPCPVEWYDGHAYAFCTSFPVPWVAASQVCQAGGYTLVAIGDAPENDFVAQTGAFYGGPYWTGLNDRGQGNEGRFRWSNGEALTYTAWAPGEPNDANGEDCVELRRDASWNDANCALTRSFVCEAD